MGYREAEPRDDLSGPPTGMVWWVFTRQDSRCFVQAKYWIDANQIAYGELGGDPELFFGPFETLEETDIPIPPGISL